MSAALVAEVEALKARVAALETVRPAVRSLAGVPAVTLDKLGRIVNEVAEAWHVDTLDVVGRNCERMAVQPRFAAIWLARRLMPHLSLARLGGLFDREHTTITHALKRAEGWYISDEDYARTVDRLLAELRAELAGARS